MMAMHRMPQILIHAGRRHQRYIRRRDQLVQKLNCMVARMSDVRIAALLPIRLRQNGVSCTLQILKSFMARLQFPHTRSWLRWRGTACGQRGWRGLSVERLC